MMYDWTTSELWWTGGVIALLLWMVIVLPFGYWLFGMSFWRKWDDEPGLMVVLTIMLFLFGPVTLAGAFVTFFFLVVVWIFKLIFRGYINDFQKNKREIEVQLAHSEEDV